MKRQLRYGTNVVYNGEIYRINSAANSEGVKICSLKTNDTITVKKNKLIATPHDKHELIKYRKNYYIVKNITCDANGIPLYDLDFANKFYDKNSKIDSVKSNDPGIQNIPSYLQEKLLSFLKFVDRYNLTIKYLNKKQMGGYQFLDYSELENIMNDLIIRCKLNVNQLSKIEHTLKKTGNRAFQIHLLTLRPFEFITQELQLISFDKAEKIAIEFDLQVNFITKCEKWTYCLFNEEKTFYIRKFKYIEKFKKFCESRNETEGKYLKYIENNVIIDKIIEGKEYKTTQKLLETEREMTDMIMDLFYDIKYEISTEEIINEINKFEEKRRFQTKNPEYALEEEQKNSVIKSIQNKLSIITGYPGTGKTEIVRCITTGLHNLYSKNNIMHCKNNSSNDNVSTSSSESESKSDNPFSEYEFKPNKCHENACTNCETRCENECEPHDEEPNKYVDPKTIALLAPTGLAFLNLQRSIEGNNYNDKISGTCHKVLYNIFQNIKIHRNIETCTCKEKENCKYRNLKIKLVVIDETSMLDIFIFYEILQLCKYFNARLIIIGDVNQLPSIGPGTVLKNLIASNCFDVTKLTNIKRQSAGSLVNTIKKMHTDIITQTQFKDDSMTIQPIKEFILNSKINRDLLLNLIQTNNLNKDNSKFITYFNSDKYLFNTVEINNLLQDIYNPNGSIIPSNSKFETKMIFKISDKIIRTENDYSSEKMRANGEEARILDFDGRLITIQYSGVQDNPETIGINELYENFKLNYCTTIHSAQGSQYDNVIFFVQPGQSYIIDKTSVYTAISRAKNRCIVISSKDDFIKCQENNKNIDNKVSLFMRESNNYELE